jgi:subtilisin family serine protease
LIPPAILVLLIAALFLYSLAIPIGLISHFIPKVNAFSHQELSEHSLLPSVSSTFGTITGAGPTAITQPPQRPPSPLLSPNDNNNGVTSLESNIGRLTAIMNVSVNIPNQYIVVLKPSTLSSGEGIAAEVKNNGADIVQTFENTIKGFAIRVPNDNALAAIRNNPNVELVEPDQKMTMFEQTLPNGINRIDGDLSSARSGSSVVSGDGGVGSSGSSDGSGAAAAAGSGQSVPTTTTTTSTTRSDIAIIDTGIDLTHPDLNVFRDVTFVPGTTSGNDDNGHGTHVAGIAAAKDNNEGVVGVDPGARLWAVKVLDSTGAGSISDIIAGIDYVTQHANEIGVANLSFGCRCHSNALDIAIHNSVAAGITFVVAAGNSAADAESFSPASNPDVITVAAIADSDGRCGGLGPATKYGNDDSFATFSNFGSVVDIAAPGVNILSTYKGGLYATFSGTSMAAPHVTGAAALYKSTHIGASPFTVKQALMTTGSTPATVCDGNGHGYFSGAPNSLPNRDGLAYIPLLYVRQF